MALIKGYINGLSCVVENEPGKLLAICCLHSEGNVVVHHLLARPGKGDETRSINHLP